MDDEVRLEGEEEMELDEASDGEDEDEETTGIPISPANSDQLIGQTTPTTPGNSNYILNIFYYISFYYFWRNNKLQLLFMIFIKIILNMS